MAAYVRDGYGAFRQPKFECGCCQILVLGFVVRDRIYVFSLYCNPDLDDRIFGCNGHHQEWLGSTTTNRHGIAAFDFATVSGCGQLVVSPTHARGETLNLLMTNVPDLVRVSVVTPIGNLDHSSLSAVISMAQAVNKLCVRRKVFLKHQVNWNTVCGALQDLPR